MNRGMIAAMLAIAATGGGAFGPALPRARREPEPEYGPRNLTEGERKAEAKRARRRARNLRNALPVEERGADTCRDEGHAWAPAPGADRCVRDGCYAARIEGQGEGGDDV